MKNVGLASLAYTLLFGVINAFYWKFKAHPETTRYVLVATVGACATIPDSCWKVAVTALLGLIIGSIEGGSGTGNVDQPVHIRDTGVTFFHDLGNGVVNDYFNASLLKRDELHDVWTSDGHKFTASLHPETGDPVVSVLLGDSVPVEARGENQERATAFQVSSFTASWKQTNYAGYGIRLSTREKFAKQILDGMFTSNRKQMTHEKYCLSIDATPKDKKEKVQKEHIDMAFTVHGQGFSTYPPTVCSG